MVIYVISNTFHFLASTNRCLARLASLPRRSQAACGGDPELCSLLLDAKADPTRRSHDVWTGHFKELKPSLFGFGPENVGLISPMK